MPSNDSLYNMMRLFLVAITSKSSQMHHRKYRVCQTFKSYDCFYNLLMILCSEQIASKKGIYVQRLSFSLVSFLLGHI